jgi:hypothetical protein
MIHMVFCNNDMIYRTMVFCNNDMIWFFVTMIIFNNDIIIFRISKCYLLQYIILNIQKYSFCKNKKGGRSRVRTWHLPQIASARYPEPLGYGEIVV